MVFGPDRNRGGPRSHPSGMSVVRTIGLLSIMLVAGCATAEPGSATPSIAATSSSGCATTLMLTDQDNQTEVCVAPGGTVNVSLSGAPGQNWSPVQHSGTGLTEQPPASRPTLGTIATYWATGAGTTDLTSSRSVCPMPSPGAMACHSLQAYRVTVTVR